MVTRLLTSLAQDHGRQSVARTSGVDGWVSLEVSPLLAHDTASTLAAAKNLHTRAGRPNLLIKIPGNREGLPAGATRPALGTDPIGKPLPTLPGNGSFLTRR